jgi:hypothetical protein
MTNTLLPPEFADLEPFASTWCLATEPERWAQRVASSMREMKSFYDACFPRAQDAIDYCDRFPLDAMPEDAARLLQLVHSLSMVSFPVEVWLQPSPIDSGSARVDRIIEPSP